MNNNFSINKDNGRYLPGLDESESGKFSISSNKQDHINFKVRNTAARGEEHLLKNQFSDDVKTFSKTSNHTLNYEKRSDYASTIHSVTFAGLFLFSFFLYFRPYEWIPAFSGFDSLTFIIGLLTLLSFFAIQLNAEWRLWGRETEVWLVLGILLYAIISIPIAKDPGLAWNTLNDTFIKVVLVFICLAAVITTKTRLDALILLSVSIGAKLGYDAFTMFQAGEFNVEGYRVKVDLGGMFGNPNDLAIHFVIFSPIAIARALAARSFISRLLWLAAAFFMVAGILVTQSRGGFLGLLASSGVLIWKFGKQHRAKALIGGLVAFLFVLLLMPGNYGLRMASIFIPSLDPVGSASERREALERSLIVTLRNPQGIGIGNSRLVGVRDHETHNAYTQVSSELGWLSFIFYALFLYLPLRRLKRIANTYYLEKSAERWPYYYAIGITAGIVGYLVSSFFASVAYQWYIYYPIAYAIGLERIVNQSGQTQDKFNYI